MKPRVAEVDQHNRFVRWCTREEIHAAHLPHRSIHVLVFDSAGRLVVQQRHRDKLTWPLAWDISCSGHVEEVDHPAGHGPDEALDEVYHAVALRELAEELGIHAAQLTRLGRFAPVPGVHYEHYELFETVHDGPYTLQPDELEAVHSLTPSAFDALRADPDAVVTPGLLWVVDWLRAQGRFR